MLDAENLLGKVKKNTWYNFSSKIVQVVLALFLIPFTIRTIGTEKYGIWALIQASTVLLACLDLGINGAYIKFFSENRKERDEIALTFSTGIIYYVGLGTLILLAVFFLPLTSLFISFFGISQFYFKEVEFALTVSMTFFVFSNIFHVFHCFLISEGRQDITSKIVIVASILNALLTVTALTLGYDLYGLGAVYAFVQLSTGGMFFFAAVRVWPEFEFSIFKFSSRVFKNMFLFGRNIQICNIADLITGHTDRLLAGFFFGVEPAGLYHVAATLVHRLRETPNLFLSALLPEACRIGSKGVCSELVNLYRNSSRKLITVIAPLFFFVSGASPVFVFIWMGKEYGQVALVTAILAVGALIGVLSGTGCVIGQAISKPDIQMKTGLLTASANIILSLLLGKYVGFFGISIATLLAFLLGCIYFFVTFHRELSFSPGLIVRVISLPLVLSLLSGGTLLPLNLFMLSSGLIPGVSSGVFIFSVELLLFTGVYFFLLRQGNHLFLGEREWKKSIFSFFFRSLQKFPSFTKES
ncbi:MAG: oligosaccharide flippase family protein [Nitrospinota bacterium]